MATSVRNAVAFLAKSTAVVLLGSIGVFVAVRAAVARDGVTGSARSFVTVAGTLTGPGITPGTRPVVTFEFLRSEDGGAPSLACRSSVAVAVGSDGAFSEAIPLHVGAPACPDNLFDGRDVSVRALVGGTEVAAAAPINPVPYAHFATNAGTAERLARGPSMISDSMDSSFTVPARSDRLPQSLTVPGLRLRLPSAGRWLLILNASFAQEGSGANDDLNNVALLAAGVPIDRRLIGGRVNEPAGQHTSTVNLVVPFTATASTDITVEITAGPTAGRIIVMADATGVGGVARLYAIPVQEGL